MQWVYFYGVCLGIVLLLAAWSRDHIAQRVSWVVGLGWVFSRLMENRLGFEIAPYVVPSFDAVLTVTLGVIGYRTRSLLCFGVVLMYLFQEIIAAVGLTTQRSGELWYYSLNGGIFSLKLLAIGGVAIASLVDRGSRRSLGIRSGHIAGRSGAIR
jgi:hypothetical protein